MTIQKPVVPEAVYGVWKFIPKMPATAPIAPRMILAKPAPQRLTVPEVLQFDGTNP